jgi:hypothetical protein
VRSASLRRGAHEFVNKSRHLGTDVAKWRRRSPRPAKGWQIEPLPVNHDRHGLTKH